MSGRYIAELRKQEDNSRYLYEMQITPGGAGGAGGASTEGEGSSASRVFKRYKLSEEKQFGSCAPAHSRAPAHVPRATAR